MKYRFLIILTCLFLTSKAQSELIVFYDSKIKHQKEFFQNDSIEKSMINLFGKWKLIDINKQGAPKEIGVTPQIVCSNYRGISFYMGKYTNLGRMKNFYRTAKVVAQEDKIVKETNAIYHEDNRANLLVKLKVTEPSGEKQETLKVNKTWIKELKKSMAKSSKFFNYTDTLNYRSKLDRKFYLDIHTYFSETDVFVSYAIFSQHNCIEPVYTNFGNSYKHIGHSKIEQAYIEVFKQAESKMKEIMQNDTQGYGFTLINKKINTTDWKQFIDSITLEKNTSNVEGIDLDLDKEWIVKGQIKEDIPLISFNFLEPVDNYAGELKKLNGSFGIHKDTVNAFFNAPLLDLTMGDDFLDGEVHNSKLEINIFPEVKVWIKNAIIPEPIEWGVRTSFHWEIELELKNIKTKLPIKGFIEPILSEEGEVNLLLEVDFKLYDLYKTYHIKGPDGPEESSNTMQFYVNLLLE